MSWQVTAYPRCEHHVFLSQCAADRSWLVHPVYEELMRGGIIPWLDREDYPYRRDSRTALRDGLLRSRHVIFFITEGMMNYRRGWCHIELAYGDLLQVNLVDAGETLLSYSLPLFFLDQGDPEIARTTWSLLRDRGIFSPPSSHDLVDWSVDQIGKFLHREQAVALDRSKTVIPGQDVHARLVGRPGLIERVTQFDPGPIPEPIRGGE